MLSQSWPTLCNPMDYSLPGSSVHGICVCVCVCVCSCLVAKSCPTLLWSHGLQPIRSSVHGISQARILEEVAISFSRGLPDPGIEPKSPALLGGFFITESPGKPQQRLSDSKGSGHFARAQAWNPQQKEPDIYTYVLYMNHFAVYGKLTQHCKSTMKRKKELQKNFS